MPDSERTRRDNAIRKQEISWLLSNIQSRIHFLEKDARRCQNGKPIQKATIEGKLSILYTLRSDLQTRITRIKALESGGIVDELTR